MFYSDGLGDRASAWDVDEGPWVRGYDVTSGPTAFRKFPDGGLGRGWKGPSGGMGRVKTTIFAGSGCLTRRMRIFKKISGQRLFNTAHAPRNFKRGNGASYDDT